MGTEIRWNCVSSKTTQNCSGMNVLHVKEHAIEELPSVPHDNHTEFVSKVLHLVYLHKSASAVDGIQAFHNIYLIANSRDEMVEMLDSTVGIREQVIIVRVF